MRKVYFISIFFIILIATLIYNIIEDNKRVDNFFGFHRAISDIIILNNDFNKFTNSPISFKNFDTIKNSVNKVKANILKIDSGNHFNKLNNKNLKKDFDSIKDLLNKKIEIIEYFKSNNAVLNNSFRNITKIVQKIDNKEYLIFFTQIISLDINPEFSKDSLIKKIESLSASNIYEELFISHSKVIIEKIIFSNKIKKEIEELNFDDEISKFEKNYSLYIQSLITQVKNIILFLILILGLAIIIFLIYSYSVLKSQLELKRFKNAVENSDNFIIVTNRNKRIKYVNSNMLNRMGYKLEDVVGKNPSIFKGGYLTKEYYKKMNETIYSGKKWIGEFINRDKDGNLIFEKASITPIFDENGNIEEFLSIKLDITKEKEILNSLKEKDHRLTQQAKMVVMNEILNSIAHQWRQPLSVISTATSGLILHKEYNTLSDKDFEELTNSIITNTNYLSNTIDNFKSFFRTGNEVTIFKIKDSFEKTYKLIDFRIENNNIKYLINCKEDIVLKGIENDLIQVLVNILTNSIEALESLQNINKFIFVDITKDSSFISIKIRDNANGIDEKYISKIFQPYFTTKYNSQGTGMGLFISHEIITKQFEGKLTLVNKEFVYEDNYYKGVETIIKLPLFHNDIDKERPVS